MADHLFYIYTGIATTAASIFEKLANNFSEHGATWLKWKTVPMNGARAMVDIWNGVFALLQQVEPEGCEYPVCHTPWSICGQEGGNEE